MTMNPPDYLLLVCDPLLPVATSSLEFTNILTSEIDALFGSFRNSIDDSTTANQLLALSDSLCASIKQAYASKVIELQEQKLLELLPRTVASSYVSNEDFLVLLSIVPETVNPLNYHHKLYTAKLH